MITKDPAVWHTTLP